MIKKKEQTEVQAFENTGIFCGAVYKNIVLKGEEMGDRIKFFNKIDLPVGSMLKDHAHVEDAEIYYILEGEVTVTDNDKIEVLHAGDAMFTADGNHHSIKNTGDVMARFVAVIMK